MSLTQQAIKIIKRLFPFRFRLARLTGLPIIGRLTDYIFFNNDDIIFLPKTKTIKINQKIDPQQNTENLVLPDRIVDHFIEKAKHRWIMNFCICRTSEGCQHYPIDLGCLFLGEAVQEIDPKMGRLVTKEEAMAHVKKCREAGLVHLIGRNKLDTLWLNVGPSKRLLTICNCCECCCLWKMLTDLATHISGKVNKLAGVNVYITDRCTGCGACTQNICFVNAIELKSDRAIITEACRGCGRCVDFCTQHAIEIVIDEQSEAIESSIRKISNLVDVT